MNINTLNFYSYAPQTGMQYHGTQGEASAAAEEALKQLVHNGVTGPELLTVTWGEVARRAAPTGDAGYAMKNALRLAYEVEHPQVIDGRMVNATGDLVLIRNIHEKDLLFHDLVLEIAVYWRFLAGKIERFKGHNFRDVQAVLALLYDKYGVTRGGEDGNMTFFNFDRRFKLSIAIQKAIGFGPEFQVAEKKLLDALDEMEKRVREALEENQDELTISYLSDMRTLVTGSFKLVDGKLRVAEVLRLRTYKMNSALWNEGISIIDAAIIVTSKKKQIRLHERNEAGGYDMIPLDIAAF